MVKKQCAVCGDKTQLNVALKWKRDNDGMVFHVCLCCAEAGKVNANSVKMQKSSKYTTYSTVD